MASPEPTPSDWLKAVARFVEYGGTMADFERMTEVLKAIVWRERTK